jgi:hypothetical protein
VQNQKNISLLRFEARAGSTGSVLLTDAVFKAQVGNVLNEQNYTMWVDTDDNVTVDTIVQKGVSAANGTVTFNNLVGGGYVIPAGKSVNFEVHADVPASLTSDSLQLMFDTAPGYIKAEEAKDGSSMASSNIFLFSTPSTIWKFVSQGSLFVTRDTNPRSRQLLGGALGDEIFRLQFRAQIEDIDVTNLQLSASGSSASSGAL